MGHDEYLSRSKSTFEGKLGGDEPFYDSDEPVSFEIKTDDEADDEGVVEKPTKKSRRPKRIRNRVIFYSKCKEIVWETGLAFESAKQFRKALTRYAVQEHVELDKYVNEPTRVRVKCTAGCPWLLFASYDSRTNDFVVKNYNHVHKCNDTTKNKLVNSLYISERYKDRIISKPGIRIFELQNLVRKELEVYIGRNVGRKARSIVLQQIMGDNVEEFKRILDYMDELLRTNPGSSCVVRLSEETFEGGIKRFQSFYICFDAMKKTFKAGCRRAIGLDGCFLKGVSKGQLLVVVCKDGNNQMLPLAWAVVEVENTFTWRWFVNILRHDVELGDGTGLTTLSDMQNGLDLAIKDLLPNVEQRMCGRHVLANFSKKWKGIEIRNCFWRCAKSTYEQELQKNLDHMEKLGDGINGDLFCCDSVDNNMAESFNSWILGPSYKTIITMLEEIRVKMMRTVGQLREFSEAWITNISPMALQVLQENTSKSMKCTLEWNGEYGFEVKDSWGNKFIVNLNNNTCTCISWMLKGVPCCHAIVALHFRKLEPIDYVAHWYTKDTYLKTYNSFIQPITNMAMWPKSTNPPVLPSEIKKLPGRPRKCRRKKQTENKTGKLSKRGVEMT
ncbi:uncharacterized protein LOC132624421 [Lycium barbarum]|uniref:uncharacterized protein LOC132624421 n=1 Tax=Lycium barbarum TaxID=112863 RepID=UPI00293F541D|nr:uncharacterized protein LOC132624421 [Lycium barbarum]